MACQGSLTVVRCPHAAQTGRHFGRSARYFVIVIVIRHETTAAARGALLLIVRTLFNDAITVAVWTGFHVCLPVDISASHDVVHRRRFSFPACVGNAAAKPLPNNGGECSKCQHYSWNVTAMAPRNGIVCLLQSLLHIALNGALRGPLFLPIPARRPLPPVRPCVFTDDPAAAHTMDGWKMRTRMETSRGSEKSGPRRRRPLPVAQPKTPVCSITVSRRLARIAGVGQDRDRMKAGGAMSVADLPVALRNRGRSRGENKCVNIVPP